MAINERQANAVQSIVLEGDGLASVCAARLLVDAKIDCVLRTTARPKLAAILLGEQTQNLLRQIFGGASDEDLFAGFTQIKRRIVQWGAADQPLVLPHAGVVAREEVLLQRLWERVPIARTDVETSDGWEIVSSRAENAVANEWSYGTRVARFARAKLNDKAEESACWVESTSAGWLFMLSMGERAASLIAVGGTAQEMLGTSRLISSRVATVEGESLPVASYPRLRRTLVGNRKIFCGGAAMSFDPLCGEGAGNAAREAFLAAALVRAALAGGDVDLLSQHYTSRLMQGFHRHLETCLRFYESGGEGEFWRNECDALRDGIVQLETLLRAMPAARYRLVDRDLVPVAFSVS